MRPDLRHTERKGDFPNSDRERTWLAVRKRTSIVSVVPVETEQTAGVGEALVKAGHRPVPTTPAAGRR